VVIGRRAPADDPERARFDDSSPLRVFVRHASGGGTTLTVLPGWPDGSFGWAKVDAELAERSDADRLFLDYVGHGDSDKPREYPYSTYERADLVEALWRARSVAATVVVAFDYSCIVSLEPLGRRIERQQAGGDPGTVIHTCLLANGGLFADGHTHPWFTTPLFKTRAGGPLMWAGQHSRHAFARFFRPVFSRSYRVTPTEVEQAYQAISRRDGVRVPRHGGAAQAPRRADRGPSLMGVGVRRHQPRVDMTTENAQRSVLLIGKSQLVLDESVAGLRDLGYKAEATNDFTDITGRFDVNEINLVVFGGQVPPDRKEELKEEIGAINPEVIFVQGLAGIPGVIINQVRSAFAASHQDSIHAPTYTPDDRSIRPPSQAGPM
jgi:pimeloyl-ACP methyl ester carboxylesterase